MEKMKIFAALSILSGATVCCFGKSTKTKAAGAGLAGLGGLYFLTKEYKKEYKEISEVVENIDKTIERTGVQPNKIKSIYLIKYGDDNNKMNILNIGKTLYDDLYQNFDSEMIIPGYSTKDEKWGYLNTVRILQSGKYNDRLTIAIPLPGVPESLLKSKSNTSKLTPNDYIEYFTNLFLEFIENETTFKLPIKTMNLTGIVVQEKDGDLYKNNISWDDFSGYTEYLSFVTDRMYRYATDEKFKKNCNKEGIFGYELYATVYFPLHDGSPKSEGLTLLSTVELLKNYLMIEHEIPVGNSGMTKTVSLDHIYFHPEDDFDEFYDSIDENFNLVSNYTED